MRPSAEEQIEFLKNIQLIINSGSFTSTYKFALLISLVNIAIESQVIGRESLEIHYRELAEQFLFLYWQQALPYSEESGEPVILHQNNGPQAAVINHVQSLQMAHGTLARARASQDWRSVVGKVAQMIKRYPAQYLQNVGGTSLEFLYQWSSTGMTITLKPGVAYILRQFNGIIRQLSEQAWLEFVRVNRQNIELFANEHDLYNFMFATERQALNKLLPLLEEMQKGHCFYCNKRVTKSGAEVDHFIPWSLYSVDTGHNFVLADRTCNSKKSNHLAAEPFLENWLERNVLHDQFIQTEFTQAGFLCNQERSNSIAKWAYQNAKANNFLVWTPTERDLIPLGSLQHLFDVPPRVL